MNDDFRAEMQALGELAAAELRAEETAAWTIHATALSPIDDPDRGWCKACQLPSAFVWHLAFEINGADPELHTYSVCTDCGEESAE